MFYIKSIDDCLKKSIESRIKVLLVTAAEIEKNKVNETLKPLDGQTDILKYNINGYEFYIGKFGNYNVVHIQTKIGSLGDGASTLAIDIALKIWQIKMVIMIGIAFGRGANCYQKIGDILISRDIFMYEKYKIKEKKDGTLNYTYSSNPYSNSGKILVKKFEDDKIWKNNDSLRPKIHMGTIASGEKIIDSENEKKKLLEHLGNKTYIIGGEMEATGLVAACSNNNIYEWLVVKGISDWGDGNKVKNKDENQKIAINNTVSYCEYIFGKDKIFDEILEDNPINILEKMYNFPIINISNNIDILDKYEVSLTPISSKMSNMIKRKKVIEALKEELKNGNHINIVGEIFAGKTTILKLLASEYGNSVKYIDLKDKEIEQVEKILSIISQILLELEIESDLIVTIDNLPKLNKNSKAQNILEYLLENANDKKIKIVFTSLTSNENILEDNIQNIAYINIDEIEKDDVVDLLNLYEAPDNILHDKVVDFIRVIGKNKLFVIRQIIKYLQKEKWDMLNDGFIGIIDGKYVLKIKGEIQDILLERISGDAHKELLYRIGCVNSDLTINEIKKISEVEPQINNPFELLREIEGSFVEHDNEKNIYTINPLIVPISKENINSNVFINVNKAMAESILEKKTLNPFDVIKCIAFFNQAKEYDEAGKLYLQTINKMIDNDIRDEWGIKSIWKDLELPQMDSDLKLQIRFAQLKYYLKFRIDYSETLELTIKLIKEENYEDFFIAGIAILFINENPYKFNELLKLALSSKNKNLEIFKNIEESMKSRKDLPNQWGIESLLWATIPKNGEIELLESWVDAFTILEIEQYARFKKMMNEFFNFEQMYSFYIDKTWVNLKSNIEEDIDKIKKLIIINENLVEFGKKIGDEFITSLAIRNIVIFKCEYLKENEGFDYGIKEVEKIDDAKSKFVITSMIGKQYYYLRKYNEAKFWLENNLEFEQIDGEIGEKIWVLLELSSIYTEESEEKSYEYAKEMLKYIEMLDIDNKIRFYMEYLIRCFFLNKLEENIEVCLQCADLTLKNREKKGLIAFFSHIIGYFDAYITSNIKLDETNKEYGKPYTGMTIYSENMNNDEDSNKKIKKIYLHVLKLLSFYQRKEEMLDFYLQIYENLKEDGMGISLLFPNELRVLLIENNHIEKAVELLKVMNVCKKYLNEALPREKSNDPFEFTEKIENIYLSNEEITVEDLSEVLIFNIIFLLLDEKMQIENIEQIEMFQKMDKQIIDEYRDIIQIAKDDRITREYLRSCIAQKEYEGNKTFEIIYRILLTNTLKNKMLINYQINLLIYFESVYGEFATEESLLKLCIKQIEKETYENRIYSQMESIKEKINEYKMNLNITNAKFVYIEMLKDLGFYDITEENINWLKEI